LLVVSHPFSAFFFVPTVVRKNDRETKKNILRLDISVDDVQMMMKIRKRKQ
jgi:hypothetical protein